MARLVHETAIMLHDSMSICLNVISGPFVSVRTISVDCFVNIIIVEVRDETVL